MKLIADFRNKEIVKILLEKINNSANPNKIYKIMEVCGTHTMAISRFGIRNLLPRNVELISGPGCPVCVTSQGEIDTIFELAERDDILLAVYGDLIRVPGSKGKNLIDLKSEGKDVRIVISPLDVLKLREESDKKIVFVSIGFETTTPATAVLVDYLAKFNIEDVYILSFNKTMPEVLEILLSDNELIIDGFLSPGHVSIITGEELYKPIIEHNKSAVITGFEPVDILSSILEIIKQVNSNEFHIVNNYKRAVKSEGNNKANEFVNKYFCKVDALWRGIGVIKKSGLKLKDKYSSYDAVEEFGLHISDKLEIPGCKCGDVLKGKIMPNTCPLFARHCTPSDPVGPCMVSSEGACAAYYKYERII